MPDESIIIPIEIDTSKGLAQLVTLSNDGQTALDDLGEAGKNAGQQIGSGFMDAGDIVVNLKAKIEDLKNNGVVSIGALEESMGQFQKALLSATDPEDIKRLNVTIAFLKGQVLELKSIGLDKHFDGISRSSSRVANSALAFSNILGIFPPEVLHITHAFDGLIESFEQIHSKTGNAKDALKSLAASFLGPLGISVVVAGAIAAFELLSGSEEKTATKTKELSAEEKAAIEKQKEFSQAVDKASGSIVGQAEKLSDLRDILLTTKSALDLLTQATINQGVARFLFDEKNVELQKILSGEIKKQLELRKQANPFADVGSFRNNAELVAIEKEMDARLKLGVSVVDLIERKKKLKENSGEIFSADDSINGLNQLAGGLEGFFKKFLDGTDKGKSAEDELIEKAKQLASFLTKTTIRNFTFEVNPLDTKEETYKRAKDFIIKALDPLQRASFPVKTQIRAAFNVIPDETFFRTLQKLSGIEATKTYAQVKKEFEAEIKRLAESNPLIIKTNAELKVAIDKQKQYEADVEKQIENLQAVINGGLRDAFAVIGESAANLISGQGFGKEIFSFLGDLITQIGKALIQYGLVKQGLQAVLKAGFGLPGLAAIGVGLSAIAIGQLIKNTQVKGFAEGGLVYGPTVGFVGEGRRTSRSNPEVISPLDKLKSFFGSMLENNLNGRSGGRVGNIPSMNISIPSEIRLYASGKDLISTISLENQSQRRGG